MIKELIYNDTRKLNGLQLIRCLACMGIMLCHTGIRCFDFAGSYGVSVFLVLSGFTMMFSYYKKNRFTSVSAKYNMKFALHKIWKLYPLHIITTLIMFVFLFTGDYKDNIASAFIKLGVNVFLVSEWLPIQANLNGVSWYLSVLVFLYFVFPWIEQHMEINYSERKAFFMIILAMVLMALGVIAGKNLIPIIINGWFSTNLFYDANGWFVYHFPISRMWEFVIGCNLGWLYQNRKIRDFGIKIWTILELLAIILTICSIGLFYKIAPEKYDGYLWNRSFIYIIPISVLIYVFAIGKGCISQLLVNSVTMYVAQVSPYVFLIHSIVFYGLKLICVRVLGINEVIEKSILLTLGIPITFVACEIWKYMIEKSMCIIEKQGFLNMNKKKI